MRFLSFKSGGREGLAVETNGEYRGLFVDASGFPGNLASLLTQGDAALRSAAKTLAAGTPVDLDAIEYLPPIAAPGKVVCVGLNYAEHSKESGYELPDYPTLFGRFNSSLTGHLAPVVRPKVSPQLDYEGELVAVIGKTGKKISEADALSHVAGYSVFNDVSVRDYQFKAPQWTPGKNFDTTGPFGPTFVTSDELPEGCKGLRLQTRLNGEVMQDAMIDDMVFSVTALVSILSQTMTLSPGDIIVTGTPSGVGFARKPQVFMKPGDVCEVEIEQVGLLRNTIVDED